MEARITTISVKKYDKLNHIELRSDIGSDNINGVYTYLVPEGKTSASPEEWVISREDSDGLYINDYKYDSRAKYEQDVNILMEVK